VTDWLRESDDLHQRVQAFIRAPDSAADGFDGLALRIADYQARTIPAFARLVRAHGSRLDRIESIPAVPVEAFRLARIAAHPAALDQVRFLTSGTTSGTRGQHCMRRTDTYRLAAVTWARRALVPANADGVTVICLAPKPDAPHHSSLGFMMQAFLEHFDPEFEDDIGQRWLLSESGVDVDGLRHVLDRASEKCRPILLLATSLALASLIDALGDERITCSGRVIVMQTGGFKGKRREISEDQLRLAVSRALGCDERHVVGEYGMTELSSQLYEGTLGETGQGTSKQWYLPPPWLRVDAVDPNDFLNLPDGEAGVASFTDLANVDSAVRILTEDRIVRRGSQIRLLGRTPGASARGCSLGDEELLPPVTSTTRDPKDGEHS
jgi:hypothetical protein